MLKEILEKIENVDEKKNMLNLGDFENQKHPKLMEESDYQKFFQGKLKAWKVKSPAELDKEDRKKFFTEVEKEWK